MKYSSGFDYCSDGHSCADNETCLNPCYGDNAGNCSTEISDGYACVIKPALSNYLRHKYNNTETRNAITT